MNQGMPWRQTDTLKFKTHCSKSKKKKKVELFIKQKTILHLEFVLPFSQGVSVTTVQKKKKKNHTRSLSIAIWTDWICGLSWDPSFMVTEVAITGRDTPHARPRACLERTNTYGTFLSSQSSGRWRMISSGSASAAITINSAMPLFRVFVAGE